jgi:hypothetical protein
MCGGRHAGEPLWRMLGGYVDRGLLLQRCGCLAHAEFWFAKAQLA